MVTSTSNAQQDTFSYPDTVLTEMLPLPPKPQVQQLQQVDKLCLTSFGVQRSSDSGISAGSREAVGRGTGPPADTHPSAALLKEGRFTVVSPWSSGKFGTGSTWRDLMGAGLGALLNPPNGVATLEVTE